MKKVLTIFVFIFIATLSFGQPPKDKLYLDEIGHYMYVSDGIHPYDFIRIEDYLFSANPENGTFTTYNKANGEKKVYPLNEIPRNYYYCKVESGNKSRPYDYGFTSFLPCTYNGKYGCVDKEGNIVMDFVWPETKYHFSFEGSDNWIIYVKGTNEMVCSFSIDYRGLIYQHIEKNHEQDFIDLGVQYDKKRVW